MGMPGKVRGDVILKDKEYLLKKGGGEKIRKAEDELRDIGKGFSYGEIEKNKFYPWGQRVLSLLAVSRVLNMDRDKVKEMGRSSVKNCPFERIIKRYFISTKSVFEKEVKRWRKNNTIGRLEVISVDEKKKEVVVRLYNVNFHPIFCDYLQGYFQAIGEKNKGEGMVSCEETKCYFKGEDVFHEFLIKW